MNLRYLLFILFLLFSLNCFADNVFLVIVKKQEQKKARGFDLMGWMTTKKKVALMDQWLALHSSANLFEFFIGGDLTKYNLEQDGIRTKQNMYRSNIGAYISIFGLEGEFEKSNEKHESIAGLFGLRLFGTANQGTNLTTYAGYRNLSLKTLNEKCSNPFLGARLNLYLLSFLGIEGNYRKYLSRKTNNIRSDAELTEYGAFIDLFFLRISWSIFREKTNYERINRSNYDLRKGTRLKAIIYM